MHTRNWMLASLTATAVCLHATLDPAFIGAPPQARDERVHDDGATIVRWKPAPSVEHDAGLAREAAASASDADPRRRRDALDVTSRMPPDDRALR